MRGRLLVWFKFGRQKAQAGDSLVAEERIQSLDQSSCFVLKKDCGCRFADKGQNRSVRAFLHTQGPSNAGDLRSRDFGPAQDNRRIGEAGTVEGRCGLAKAEFRKRHGAATPWMTSGLLLRGPAVPVSHRLNGHSLQAP